MTIVVDASVAVKWLVRETDSDKADAILQGAKQKRLSLLAPEILPAEIGSFLWKAVFRIGLSPAEALAHYGRFQRACPALVRISALAESALKLALLHSRSVYDCLYVALASETPCDFVTADEKLFNALNGSVPQVRLLREWV